MKVLRSALAILAVVLFAGTSSAFAFSTVTVDANGQDGSARFRDTDKLTDSTTARQKSANENTLFQSSDGKFSMRASIQGNNGFGSPSMNNRKSFSDYIPVP